MIKKYSIYIIILILFTLNFLPIVYSIESPINNIYSNNKESIKFNKNSFNMINISFISCNLSIYSEIYYPTDETQKYPGLIFIEGYSSCIEYYKWIPEKLAENGYITLIFDLPGQGKSEGIFPDITLKFDKLKYYPRYLSLIETPMHYFKGECKKVTKDALSYLLNESPVKHMINKSSIGFIGHSLGGIIALDTLLEDKRPKAVIILSNGNPINIDKIEIPIQFQGGDMDIFFQSIPILLRCYKKSNYPKELIVISMGTHLSFMNKLYPFCLIPKWQKEIIIHYSIAWFNYYLKNDENAYQNITNGYNNLSKIVKSRYNMGEGEKYLE